MGTPSGSPTRGPAADFRSGGTFLLVLLTVVLAATPFANPGTPTLVAIEGAATLVAVATAVMSRRGAAAALAGVAAITGSSTWFSTVDTGAGGSNEFALVFWYVLGFPAAFVLAVVAAVLTYDPS